MLGLILFILMFLTFSVFFYGVFLFLFQSKLEMKKRISRFVPVVPKTKKKTRLRDIRSLQLIKEKGRQQIGARMDKQKETALKILLSEAGHPFSLSAIDFTLCRVLFGSVFSFLMFILFISQKENMLQVILLSSIAGVFGYMYPMFYLKAKKKQKTLVIQKMMPDFFDMVNVSIEAGLGLDGALTKVSKQMKGPLSDEFARTLEDIRLGTSKKDAFQQLAARVPSDQFKGVINALIQADQMGIGMAKVLRAQTTRIREQRRQQVKEQAMKAPIKMMFPMILFIFPTLFVVLMGPILVKMVTEWI